MDKISGMVEKITYQDEESGFSVIKLKDRNYRELITVVGNFINLNIGSIIEAEGDWTLNLKFGRQFKVINWKESLPTDVHGIEKYLGSGLIKGIGSKYAKMIVTKFGAKTLQIIENEPHRLTEIPKLGKKKAEALLKGWEERKDIKNLMMFLQKMNISISIGYKIFKVYGKDSIMKLKENPYRLIDEVNGVGFKTSDAIAEKIGVDRESYQRCRAGILYILEFFGKSEGHCYMPFEELVKKSSKILGIEDCKIIITYDYLIKNGELIFESPDKVYLPPFYHSEIGLAKRIKSILKFPNFKKYSEIRLEKEIKISEQQNNISYDESQRNAIKTAVTSNFSVVTGGAGVGKTTVTKAIIDVFQRLGKSIILAAPTGRAAKRMTEVTNLESKTIHRLLESKQGKGFGKNSDNKLIGDVLIVDESSMIDLILMYNLIKAVPDSMKVILIGDVNQLPSVGSGNVLKDIIESGVVPVISLTKIYRQALTSLIVLNSHKINEGELPDLTCNSNSDFFFIEENDPEKAVEKIVKLCVERIPKFYKVNPIYDVQVLSPMKKGVLGTDNLNKVLQSKLNSNGPYLKFGSTIYRIGDKVMQIKNNYDKEVFNGDMGIISGIDENKEFLEVEFDSKIITYSTSELEEIVLSYACTIHKSQGGEYPIAIIALSSSHFMMLQRNLLYTGVTRAKKVCIIIGERSAISRAVRNNTAKKRYTYLSERLEEA